MGWLQRPATVENERSAHRTLHSSLRTTNAQYDEAACRHPSWSASGDGDGQDDDILGGVSGRSRPVFFFARVLSQVLSISYCAYILLLITLFELLCFKVLKLRRLVTARLERFLTVA